MNTTDNGTAAEGQETSDGSSSNSKNDSNATAGNSTAGSSSNKTATVVKTIQVPKKKIYKVRADSMYCPPYVQADHPGCKFTIPVYACNWGNCES